MKQTIQSKEAGRANEELGSEPASQAASGAASEAATVLTLRGCFVTSFWAHFLWCSAKTPLDI